MPVKDKARKYELHREWYKRNYNIRLLDGARRRAAERGMEFDLTAGDIVIPDKCPVLGIPLSPTARAAGPGSPSLDRIENDRGYVRGNVVVVSHLANTIKSVATPKQLRQVASFYTDLWARTYEPKFKPEDF